MTKSLNKLGTEENFLNWMKLSVKNKQTKNTTLNIILHGEKLKAFPLRSETRGKCTPLSALLSSTTPEALANTLRREKEMKDIQIGKEEMKLSLLTDDMIICIENPK